MLDQVRTVILRKHYSRRTEESYVGWIKRYILFHRKRHPLEMGEPEVTLFLNHLARDRFVAASTQNQALSALLFLYKEVLDRDLEWLTNLERVKRPARVPTVLTALEVQSLLAQLDGTRWLMVSLLYGAELHRLFKHYKHNKLMYKSFLRRNLKDRPRFSLRISKI